MSTPFSPGQSGEAPAATFAAREGLEGSMPSVMVIDDSPAIRKIIEVSFARVGIPVTAFGDGISAIRALANNEVAVPALLLLDLRMPRMDGYEVASVLRGHEAFANTVIIMLTAHDGVIDRMRAKMIGARGFITKPFRVQDVVNTVCSHLRIPVPTGAAPYGGRGGF